MWESLRVGRVTPCFCWLILILVSTGAWAYERPLTDFSLQKLLLSQFPYTPIKIVNQSTTHYPGTSPYFDSLIPFILNQYHNQFKGLDEPAKMCRYLFKEPTPFGRNPKEEAQEALTTIGPKGIRISIYNQGVTDKDWWHSGNRRAPDFRKSFHM